MFFHQNNKELLIKINSQNIIIEGLNNNINELKEKIIKNNEYILKLENNFNNSELIHLIQIKLIIFQLLIKIIIIHQKIF